MSRLTSWAVAAAAAVASGGLAGCYETPQPACVFLCGEGGACPDGYRCDPDDNRCHRVEAGGGLASCEDVLHDAAVDPDGAAIDAGDPDGFPACATPLAPVDDGTGAARQALLISEIDPGQHLEVFNNTDADIDLGTVGYYLLSDPQSAAVSAASIGAGVTVRAGGQALIGWPADFTDIDLGGEVALYLDDSDFDDGTKIMSFVCWGSSPHASVKTLAEGNGKWTAGACPAALTAGAIHRLAGTDGRDAADFDVATAPSPAVCD